MVARKGPDHGVGVDPETVTHCGPSSSCRPLSGNASQVVAASVIDAAAGVAASAVAAVPHMSIDKPCKVKSSTSALGLSGPNALLPLAHHIIRITEKGG